MAKKQPFTKKQLTQKAARRAIVKALRSELTPEQKQERKIQRHAKREKREAREIACRVHVRQRRYVFLAKHTETDKILAFDSIARKWSATRATLYGCARHSHYTKPKDLLAAGQQLFDKNTNNENYKFFMARVGSKKCPIKIDYLSAYDQGITQVNQCALPFSLKNEGSS